MHHPQNIGVQFVTKTIHFDHKIVAGFHVITSPDVIGFHVTGRTAEEAEREAVSVLDFLRRADGRAPMGRLKAVNLEYESA